MGRVLHGRTTTTQVDDTTSFRRTASSGRWPGILAAPFARLERVQRGRGRPGVQGAVGVLQNCRHRLAVLERTKSRLCLTWLRTVDPAMAVSGTSASVQRRSHRAVCRCLRGARRFFAVSERRTPRCLTPQNAPGEHAEHSGMLRDSDGSGGDHDTRRFFCDGGCCTRSCLSCEPHQALAVVIATRNVPPSARSRSGCQDTRDTWRNRRLARDHGSRGKRRHLRCAGSDGAGRLVRNETGRSGQIRAWPQRR